MSTLMPRWQVKPVVFLVSVWVACTAYIIVLADWSHANSASKLPILEQQGGDFTLLSHHSDSRQLSLHDFRGKVVLLTFGYTYCPDICPMGLTHLKQVIKQLGVQSDQVQTLFITIDPERDTPEHLKTYLTYFHPSFIGLTGSETDIAKVARQYGNLYMKQEQASGEWYLYAHSDTVYVIDQRGRLRGRYPSTGRLDQMAKDIQILLAAQDME